MLGLILFAAIIVLPFGAEAYARKIPENENGGATRSASFYLLTPLMGAFVYGSFAVFAAHPILALAGSTLFYAGLTAVSNKKYEVLDSPFNAHDFDNLRNLYIYPEFYLSYVGWPIIALVIAAFAGIIGLSLNFEESFPIYGWIGTPHPALSYFLFIGLWLVFIRVFRGIFSLSFNEQTMNEHGVTLELKEDITRFGLFPTVMLYRMLLKMTVDKTELRTQQITAHTAKPQDIIAIQGESYFDLERLFTLLPEAKRTGWQALRNLEADGVTTGTIEVPAWGAYTMQTEFSFLSMMENNKLGVDRINPYMRFAQKPVTTIASLLKDAGYRTICIHPAKKEFFRRSDVMPNLGFEEFIGIEEFNDAPYFGKYIADSALGKRIDEIVAEHHTTSDKPLFIFAITIESHGPWASGRLDEHVNETALIAENPTGDREFALYQQHMENLMGLFQNLSTNSNSKRPRTVALYGDHMPALGSLFKEHGFTDIPTDYLIWNSEKQVTAPNTMAINDFAAFVMKESGVSLKR
ncbi:LTA synthase family protein [Kordiimonas sp. SCSIO 12603]|uniref:LTA synthase family protein n=1 Tax=Kordiimonas sp. SCSIO 12603 TaxID=2829596 RepID=UPI002106AA5B|nr:LTA synthase family protein [Kordiimonas sp. SCSIO 12603]UTW60032.1 LTA synthase family protein [Kordiimonas sp. SCSIO 12603]